MATLRDLLKALTERQKFLTTQRQLFADQGRQFENETDKLERLQSKVRADLKGYLLADIGDDDLLALEQKLAYPRLLTIKKSFDEQLESVESQLAELKSKPEIEHNEHYLVQAQDELGSIQEAHDSLESEIAAWEQSRWWGQLKSGKYFDDDYQPGLADWFWNWRAVSFLMDELEERGKEFDTGAEIQQAYRKLRSEADRVFELNDDLEARIHSLNQLKKRHDDLVAQPNELFKRLYDALGDAVLDHLDACPLELRVKLAEDDRHLQVFLKKMSGLEKQIQYLRELRLTRVGAVIQSLDMQSEKLERKIAKTMRKLSRGKREVVAPEQLTKLREFKKDKWEKRLSRVEKVRHKVAHFDHYDRGSLSADFLWWMLITDGMPGRDIYEVKVFMEQHPGWTPADYSDDGLADSESALDGAAVAMADEMENGSDFDLLDVS